MTEWSRAFLLTSIIYQVFIHKIGQGCVDLIKLITYIIFQVPAMLSIIVSYCNNTNKNFDES